MSSFGYSVLGFGTVATPPSSGTPANPSPSLAVTNIGHTGSGGGSSGNINSVDLIPNRQTIGNNNGDTLKIVPTVTLASGATIASDALQILHPNSSGTACRQDIISNVAGGASPDVVSWIVNQDFTTYNQLVLAPAIDTTLSSSDTINVAQSLSDSANAGGGAFFFAQVAEGAGTSAVGGISSGDTVDIKYTVTDSNGNTAASSAVTITFS